MNTTDVVILGVIVGLLACGGFSVWLFRRQPDRVLCLVLLTLGACLLAYGHLQWAARHESPAVKEALFIRHVIAGWALTGMGFVGLMGCGRVGRDGEDRKS